MPPFFPIYSLIIIIVITITYNKSIRRSILTGAIIWGIIIVFITEVLSLFKLITYGWMLSSWLIILFSLIILLILRIRFLYITNFDLLFDDGNHLHTIKVAFVALRHLDFRFFVKTLPAYKRLFINIIALWRGKKPSNIINDYDHEESDAKKLSHTIPSSLESSKTSSFIRVLKSANIFLQSTLFCVLIIGVLLIVIATGVIAFNAPPNNYDSMHSHMGKIPYWIQNHSIAHYPTHAWDSLRYEPFSGFSVLQFYILSAGDKFANCVQWLSMIGCLIGVSLIAKRFGAKFLGQILAVVLCATIPMGIMQSTSTQVDYVASFWLVCFVCFFLISLKIISWPIIVALGSSLALALLTKTTNYFFAFPFVIWLVLSLIRQIRFKAFIPIISVVSIVLLVNAPHYSRNIRTFGHPLGLIVRSNVKKVSLIALGCWNASSTNLRLDESNYGSFKTPLLVDVKKYPNYVTFDVSAEDEGLYELYSAYATGKTSPFDVYVNEYKCLGNVGSEITGGYYLNDVRNVYLGTIQLKKGENSIKLHRDAGPLPHIEGIMIKASEFPITNETGSAQINNISLGKTQFQTIRLPHIQPVSRVFWCVISSFVPSCADAATQSLSQLNPTDYNYEWEKENYMFGESENMELMTPKYLQDIGREIGFDRFNRFTFPWIMSSLIKNIAMQMATSDKINNKDIQEVVDNIHKMLGIDLDFTPLGEKYSWSYRFMVRQMLDEDIAVNPDHFLLFILCLALMLFSKKVKSVTHLRKTALCIVIGFILLSIWFGWSPYNSRRLLPLFIIGTPVIAITLCRFIRIPFILEIFAAVMLWFSYPWVVGNTNRPIIGNHTIFNTPRYEQYFKKFEHLRVPYKAISTFLSSNKISSVGFYGKKPFVDYPLNVAIREKCGFNINIRHFGVENLTKNCISSSDKEVDPEIIVSWDPMVTGIYTKTTSYSSIWTDGNLTVLADNNFQIPQDEKLASEIDSHSPHPAFPISGSTNQLINSSTHSPINLLAESMKQCFAQADAQILKNGRFLNGMENWRYWQYGGTYTNNIKFYTGILKIENPYKKLIGLQQNVPVISGEVYRLSGVARSMDTTDSSILFGGRVAFVNPPQKEKQLVWMTEYKQWSLQELIFTNRITGNAKVVVDMGYGSVGSTGEFANIRLDKVETY